MILILNFKRDWDDLSHPNHQLIQIQLPPHRHPCRIPRHLPEKTAMWMEILSINLTALLTFTFSLWHLMKPWIGGWDSRFSSILSFSLQHVQPRIPGFLHVDDSHISTFSNECYKVVSTCLKTVRLLPKCKYESIENVFETLPRILHWISIDVLLDHLQVNLPFNRPFSKGWTATNQQVLSFPTSYCSWKVKSIFFC